MNSGAATAVGSMARLFSAIGRLITFPAAVIFALVGQFLLGWLIMALTPQTDPAAPVDTAVAVWAQVVLLLIQGLTLVFAVSRARLEPSRVYFAIAALVWAIASMLLLYVALQCDLAGVCL
jgi:hypothetical protein